VHYVG